MSLLLPELPVLPELPMLPVLHFRQLLCKTKRWRVALGTEAEAQCGTKGGWLSRAEGVFLAKRKAKTAKWHLPAAHCNE